MNKSYNCFSYNPGQNRRKKNAPKWEITVNMNCYESATVSSEFGFSPGWNFEAQGVEYGFQGAKLHSLIITIFKISRNKGGEVAFWLCSGMPSTGPPPEFIIGCSNEIFRFVMIFSCILASVLNSVYIHYCININI